MKMAIVAVLLGIMAFLAAVIVPLALSGNLSSEAIGKAMKKESPVPEAARSQGEVDGLVRALKDREAELDRREEKVKAEEARLKKMQAELDDLRAELANIHLQVQEALGTEDAGKAERVKETALAISKMKPANAAESLKDWTPEDAAEVLRNVKERERGKILDAMEPTQAAQVLKSLQNSKL